MTTFKISDDKIVKWNIKDVKHRQKRHKISTKIPDPSLSLEDLEGERDICSQVGHRKKEICKCCFKKWNEFTFPLSKSIQN